jgi:hypothetical protein
MQCRDFSGFSQDWGSKHIQPTTVPRIAATMESLQQIDIHPGCHSCRDSISSTTARRLKVRS